MQNNTSVGEPGEFALKILAATALKIKISECQICKSGIDGIPVPSCINKCDLPLELKNDQYGKVKVVATNLVEDKWNFPCIEIEDYDTYVLICFDKGYQNLERVYAIPKEKMREHVNNR